MAADQRDALEVLRFELYLIRQGAYRVTRHGRAPLEFFKDSPTCLDFAETDQRHSCGKCLLSDFIPGKYQYETSACHTIPLDAAGNSIRTLKQGYNRLAVERAICGWLRDTVMRLEHERGQELAECV